MIYMAFDFGTASWGCAVGDELTQTAQAVSALSAQRGKPDWELLQKLVAEWQPKAFVMGYPLKASGERFKLTDQVDKAILTLQEHYPHMPLYTADERLTTVEAKAALFAKKGYKGLEKGAVDSESAKLILLGWFEQKMFDGNN